jgi:hypothetical protein
VRVPGLLSLLGLVAIGMGSSVVFWRWQAGKQIEAAHAVRASLPPEGEARLETWLEHARPLVHTRLLQLRLDHQRPWLVTHVVETTPDPATHEIWGVDLTGVGPEVTRREGMRILVELPAARHLGTGPLVGDKSVNVPRYRPGSAIEDPDRRAEYVAGWFLSPLAEALAGDIEGASLEVRVGGGAASAAGR